ncbi:hypothetical protein BD410DRAFT_687969, partial [Rickenella mellea]
VFEWSKLRDSFLDELLRLDGLGSQQAPLSCHGCGAAGNIFRCVDCRDTGFYCSACLCKEHSRLPLHRIEQWDEGYFKKSSLHSLGLRFQLGHDDTDAHCTHPVKTHEPMTIIDVSGIHRVHVDFCECFVSNGVPRRAQLLRARWWPATIDRPQTAVTLNALELFLQLTLQSKLNVYDFYLALAHLSDNWETLDLKHRYTEISRCIHEYRHIMMAKRGARGHDPEGINATKPGECAVECPACPQPGRNLPENFSSASQSERFKYALFLAMDANFKLKLKERGIKDAPLGDGWGYFVPSVPYKDHLATYKGQQEICETTSCQSELRAVDHANLRGNQKLAVNGVGGVNCSRHALNRPVGFGDLQRGEKYCNMDYIVLSTLEKAEIKTLYLSYDIACQWFKNLPTHIESYPLRLQLTPTILVIVAIPKLHLEGHGPECQAQYSLNFIPGSARTCGESIEQIWSGQNTVAMSTREMTPGNRQDTLDCHLGGWNHRKVVGLGTRLLALMRDAVPMKAKHAKIFEELSSSLPAALVSKWVAMVEAWEADNSQPNPYLAQPRNGTSLAAVKLDLAKQEAADAAAGTISLHEVTASVFLSTGLELEDQQYVFNFRSIIWTHICRRRHLCALMKAASVNSISETTDIQQKLNALEHRIKVWRKLQAIYMPAVTTLLEEDHALVEDENAGPVSPEDVNLYLPSDLPSNLQCRCSPTLARKEFLLRVGQADDCILQLRRQLHMKANLWNYRLNNVTGQRATTRARDIMDRFDQKIKQIAEKYRFARLAILALATEEDIDTVKRFEVLNDSDIKGLGRADADILDDTDVRISEGRRTMSWIWRVAVGNRDGEADEDFDEDMKIEWMKTRARAQRWDEEVSLVFEEMRRTLEFFEWRATFWEMQAGRRTEIGTDFISGLTAYAAKQAAGLRRLARRFATLWILFLKKSSFSAPW